MKSSTTDDFWNAYRRLPSDVREQARQAYRLWRADSRHPSLHFKCISTTDPIYSIRVGRRYRALGVMIDPDHVLWYWIGSHAEYDRIIGT